MRQFALAYAQNNTSKFTKVLFFDVGTLNTDVLSIVFCNTISFDNTSEYFFGSSLVYWTVLPPEQNIKVQIWDFLLKYL